MKYVWHGDARKEWYDWAVVWRYWNGQADGLRMPYDLEIRELFRLAAAAELSRDAMAVKCGLHERTVERWVERGLNQ